MAVRKRPSSIEDDVLDLVTWCKDRAAERRPAPTNQEIAQRFGYRSQGSGMMLLKHAETANLIVVTRFNNFRIVADPRGSWSTATEGRV